MKKVKEYLSYFKSISKEKIIIAICAFLAFIAIVLSAILIASASSQERPPSYNNGSSSSSEYKAGEIYPQADNSLEYQSLGNGSCVVIGIGTYSGEELEIPEKNHCGDTVVGIAASAFEGCDEILSIHIPATVESLGDGAFKGCSSLVAITVERSNSKFSASGGVLYSKNKSVLFCYPSARIGSSYLLNLNVKAIAADAFYGVQRLSKINYEGTAAEFAQIVIGDGNRLFSSLPVTCNYFPSK